MDGVPTAALRLALLNARRQFEELRVGKEGLLRLLDESEVPESVYNSNAIENSTLTLEETERILLAVEISRHMDLREVHEAQNLARVVEYIRANHAESLTLDRILLLHKMLMSNIDEAIAGRFRSSGEYVRVGTHIAPPPEQVEALLTGMLVRFASDLGGHPIERLARVHLTFENIHPFLDGNGRIGRVVLNYLLYQLGFPPIIVRTKGKEKYYATLRAFDTTAKVKPFQQHLSLLVLESMHRRIAYLRGAEIAPAADVARSLSIRSNVLLNQAQRQVIPAFRERGVWKLPADYRDKTDHRSESSCQA
jgi:Fic family protein